MQRVRNPYPYLILAAVLLALVLFLGCTQRQRDQMRPGDFALDWKDDSTNNTRCYFLRGMIDGGVSCREIQNAK